MPNTRLTQAQMQQAVDTFAKAEGVATVASDMLGIPRGTFQCRLRAAQQAGLKPSAGIADPENIKHLRMELKSVENELAALKKQKLDETTVRNVIVGLKDAIDVAEIPSWLTNRKASKSLPGVPTLFCSDWHWGEVVSPTQVNGVNQFNLKIARTRLRKLVESSVYLLKIISPKMDYPGIVVPLGGDMISGDIHEELETSNEMPTMPTVLDLYGNLVWMVNELLKHFPQVFLPCVTGNHGRNTHKIRAKGRNHTSFDWLLYCFLAKHFEGDKRVRFFIPDGSDAYYKVYGHRYLLTHGDQFRGGDGMIGALGPIIRGDHRKRSRNGQIGMDYDTMLLGHFHQYIHLTRLIVNGSLKGLDEYSYTANFGFEQPQQALWLTHPTNGITFRMPVFMEQSRDVKPAEWVAFTGASA